MHEEALIYDANAQTPIQQRPQRERDRARDRMSDTESGSRMYREGG